MVEGDNIVELAERIVQQYHPERIILFGSYAYGRPTADSETSSAGAATRPARTLSNSWPRPWILVR
jgi:uncharacterized protein